MVLETVQKTQNDENKDTKYSTNKHIEKTSNGIETNIAKNLPTNNINQNVNATKEKGEIQELLSNHTNKFKNENKAYRNLLFKFINSRPNTDLEFHYAPTNGGSANPYIILKSKGDDGNQKTESKFLIISNMKFTYLI